jgi:hypothetical protein
LPKPKELERLGDIIDERILIKMGVKVIGCGGVDWIHLTKDVFH